jgi:hypothetical protein
MVGYIPSQRRNTGALAGVACRREATDEVKSPVYVTGRGYEQQLTQRYSPAAGRHVSALDASAGYGYGNFVSSNPRQPLIVSSPLTLEKPAHCVSIVVVLPLPTMLPTECKPISQPLRTGSITNVSLDSVSIPGPFCVNVAAVHCEWAATKHATARSAALRSRSVPFG